MRTSKTYNEIVGITKDGKLFILEDIFEYVNEDGSVGLHGATRYEMGVITKEDIGNRNDIDEVMFNYKDVWQDMVANNQTELGLKEWAEEQIEDLNPELYTLSDDPSFRQETQEAYDRLPDSYKGCCQRHHRSKRERLCGLGLLLLRSLWE